MLKLISYWCLSGSLMISSAAPPSIGTVRSTGDFRMDGSITRGNTTVFDGSLIETTAVRSTLDLSDAEVTLAPASRARVYRNRIILEKGAGFVRGGERQVVEAAMLKVSSSSKGSVFQVELSSSHQVKVSAQNGSTEVHNQAGLLVANVPRGMALAFEADSGAVNVARLTGVVEARNGRFFMTDTLVHITAELQGAGLAKYVGKRVELEGLTIHGAMPAPGASQVVEVKDIRTPTVKDAPRSGRGAVPAGAGAAGGVAARGIGPGTTVAIVGGVAAGATVGGLAAVGSFAGSAPVSRQ